MNTWEQIVDGFQKPISEYHIPLNQHYAVCDDGIERRLYTLNSEPGVYICRINRGGMTKNVRGTITRNGDDIHFHALVLSN